MTAPARQPSLTDLTDDQWHILPPHLPTSKPGGRPRAVDRREVINTLLYRNRTGCPGDMRPHDLLPKRPVSESVAPWRREGTWQHMMDAWRAAVRTPQAPSQEPPPRAARIASPSVQTTEQGGDRGAEGGKTRQGRKRHVRVAVLGLWLVVFVGSAAMADAGAAPQGLKPVGRATSPRGDVIGADRKDHQHGLTQWIAPESPGNGRLDVVRRPEGSQGCGLRPQRWVVARPLAWLGRCRRHSQDDERRPDSSASMVRVSAIHLLRKRLKPAKVDQPFRYRVAA
jgi:putative transposase